LLDQAGCFDEVLAVAVVLLDPGRDRKDVRVKNYIRGIEADCLRENIE